MFHWRCCRRCWHTQVTQVDPPWSNQLPPSLLTSLYYQQLYTQLPPVGRSVEMTRSAWQCMAAAYTASIIVNDLIGYHHRYPSSSWQSLPTPLSPCPSNCLVPTVSRLYLSPYSSSLSCVLANLLPRTASVSLAGCVNSWWVGGAVNEVEPHFLNGAPLVILNLIAHQSVVPL